MDSTSTLPNAYANGAAPPNYVAQSVTTEDLLKSETVGLVKLDDFRKRRAEVLERKEREKREGGARGTPTADGGKIVLGDSVPSSQPVKKKRKAVFKGKLSFGVTDDDDVETSSAPMSTINTPRSITPTEAASDDANANEYLPLKRQGPNAALRHAPKVTTKAALAKEARIRDELRKTFLETQEIVKATEFLMPFVFYDGTSIPGGVCRVKKGEHVWLFLDKARKLGAELGVGGVDKSRKEWARVGVDDLMLVKGEIIIPHHYEFYYFIAGKTIGFNGPIFNVSAKPTAGSPTSVTAADSTLKPDYDPLCKVVKKKEKGTQVFDSELEGYGDDPNLTRVVDRRWYEKNKHIFPASVWEEFDPTKDYTKEIRKDTVGNSFFFS